MDDRQARLYAARLKLKVIGRLGILLRAKKDGVVPALKPLLEKLAHERFYPSQELLEFVLHEAGESQSALTRDQLRGFGTDPPGDTISRAALRGAFLYDGYRHWFPTGDCSLDVGAET